MQDKTLTDQGDYERSPLLLKGAFDQNAEAEQQERTEERDFRESQKWTNIFLAVVTALGVIVASVSACIAAYQSYLTRAAIVVAAKQAKAADDANRLSKDAMIYARNQSERSSVQTERQNDASRRLSEEALKETKLSNQINRQALTSVQRAFVVFRQGVVTNGITDPTTNKTSSWQFLRVLENTGNTPTRHLRSHSNVMWMDTAMPADFSFPDLGDTTKSLFVIAPKDTVSGAALVVSADVLEKVEQHKMHLYFWGWAEYGDIFNANAQHVSMYCDEARVLSSSPANGGTMQFNLLGCPNHNCTDEDCNGEAGDPRHH